MKYFDDFLRESQAIIHIPSVQADPIPGKPFGKDVADCLDYVLDLAKKFGFRTYNNGYYYGYAEIGEGELFGILGHLDVVPFGIGWDYPPTSGAIVDGVMYGRGVLDDKVPILSTLFAVKELVDSGLIPNKRIRIIFGCNEESGWKCIEKYVECEEMPVNAFSPDSDFPVIFAEKGVLNYLVSVPMAKDCPLLSIKGGERPNMVMDSVDATLRSSEKLVNYLLQNVDSFKMTTAETIDLHFEGVSAHGSTPELGKNAFHTLLGIMSAVYGGDWSVLMRKLIPLDGSGVKLDIEDSVSHHLSMNVGTVNMKGNTLQFSLDIRYPISYKKEYIYDSLRESFPDATIEETGAHSPLFVDKDSYLVKNLLEAYNEYAGEVAEPIAIGGATYARALDNAVAFGPVFPGRESTIHQKNERVSIDDLKNMYEIYMLAIRKLCFD